MQEIRPGGAAPGQDRAGERAAGDATRVGEAARPQTVFEARREEMPAAHPDPHIAFCAGKAFAGRQPLGIDTRRYCLSEADGSLWLI